MQTPSRQEEQTTAALSSTEAEDVALATATTKLRWLINIARDLGFDLEEPIVVYSHFVQVGTPTSKTRRWEEQFFKRFVPEQNH